MRCHKETNGTLCNNTNKARVPVTVLHVKGNIDSTTYQAFQAEAEKLIADGAENCWWICMTCRT